MNWVEAIHASSPWPMFQRDVRHSGRANVAGPITNQIRWSVDLGVSISPATAPVIDNLGNILIGTMNGQAYAITPNGQVAWNTTVGGSLVGPFGVTNNGRIVVPNYNDTTYVLDPSSGSVLWKHRVGICNSAPTIDGNVAYVSGNFGSNGYVWKLDIGSLTAVWQSAELRNLDRSSPIVALGGQIVVGTTQQVTLFSSGQFKILSNTGGEICAYNFGFFSGRGVRSSVAQTPSGYIVGATNNDIPGSYGESAFAISGIGCTERCDRTNVLHWYSSPAITSDERVVLGTTAGVRYYTTTCSPVGLRATGPIINASPILDVNNVLYICDENGRLWAWADNGDTLWTQQLESAATSGTIDAFGNLYVATTAGRLYCFGNQSVSVERGRTSRISLSPALPNPFIAATTIILSLPNSEDVEVGVYDVTGRLVAWLHRGRLAAGSHPLRWEAQSSSTPSVPPGIYFVTARGHGWKSNQRVLFLR